MINKTAAFTEPLAPQVLKQAGVALEDALWFSRLPMAAKVKALDITERGKKLLGKVREYHQAAAQSSASLAA